MKKILYLMALLSVSALNVWADAVDVPASLMEKTEQLLNEAKNLPAVDVPADAEPQNVGLMIKATATNHDGRKGISFNQDVRATFKSLGKGSVIDIPVSNSKSFSLKAEKVKKFGDNAGSIVGRLHGNDKGTAVVQYGKDLLRIVIHPNGSETIVLTQGSDGDFIMEEVSPSGLSCGNCNEGKG